MPFKPTSNNGWVNYPGYSGQDMASLDDQDFLKAPSLYSYENAQTAWDNVMQDRGYNPYSSNPFMQRMRQQARPLAQAFLIDAGTAGQPGSNYASGNIMDVSDNPYNYAGWLNRTMNQYNPGQGRIGGGVYQTLRSARQNFPAAIQAARRAYEGQQSGAQGINPYAELLHQQFAANESQGAVAAYQLLNTPLMSSNALRQAYGTALDRRYNTAMRNLPDAYTGDLWREMFGI